MSNDWSIHLWYGILVSRDMNDNFYYSREEEFDKIENDFWDSEENVISFFDYNDKYEILGIRINTIEIYDGMLTNLFDDLGKDNEKKNTIGINLIDLQRVKFEIQGLYKKLYWEENAPEPLFYNTVTID